jgi:hypothetical protein
MGGDCGDAASGRPDRFADRGQLVGPETDRWCDQHICSGTERIDHHRTGVRDGNGDQGRSGSGEQLAMIGPGGHVVRNGELLTQRRIGFAQPDDAYPSPPAQ